MCLVEYLCQVLDPPGSPGYRCCFSGEMTARAHILTPDIVLTGMYARVEQCQELFGVHGLTVSAGG